MSKNSRMALWYQNQGYMSTDGRYGLHSSTSISVHGAFVTVLGLLKKKKMKKKKNLYKTSFLPFSG